MNRKGNHLERELSNERIREEALMSEKVKE
jgi:hypothetical protein